MRTYIMHASLYFMAILGVGYFVAELPPAQWLGFFLCYAVIVIGEPKRPPSANP